MNKKIITLAFIMGLATSGMAQSAQTECKYNALQEIVRSAETATDITRLIERGANFNEPVHCGGSLLELAILRGNVGVLKALIKAGKLDVNKPIKINSNMCMPVGTPNQIPPLFFAGYKSADVEILDTLIKAGADLMARDSYNQTLLFYLDQNPVLRNTPKIYKIMGKVMYGNQAK